MVTVVRDGLEFTTDQHHFCSEASHIVESLEKAMKMFKVAALLCLVGYSIAGPCPFHQLVVSGVLTERDSMIAHELASHPEYIPALDKRLIPEKCDTETLEKRDAAAEPQGGLGGVLGGILGNPLGGGLCMSIRTLGLTSSLQLTSGRCASPPYWCPSCR